MNLVDALKRPDSYPSQPAAVELRETHISWVFLAGKRAYKLKKPLVLDFLDYGTAARRREMCREEVRLNQRLAPDIYLGVRGVALVGERAELVAEDDPRALDFVVEMRRYEEQDTVAARLQRGELSLRQIIAVGGALARFHARARRVGATRAPVLVAERRFERNLHELLACVEQRGEVARVQALERFAHAFIAARADTFGERAFGGLIREGHGDLRAEHVLVAGDRVQVVDCVEFDQGLRELDVCDDLAFLVFDLAALGGERFCDPLVGAYRESGGDPGDEPLIAFYAAHRALVRAKVALVRAGQLPQGSSERSRESARARDRVVVAERFAWRARLPLVIIVCGVPASGKSHLAHALAELSGLPYLSSDLARKRLAGIEPTQAAPPDTYSAQWNLRTYAELGRAAARELSRSRGVIVDATFRRLGDRAAFIAAFGGSATALFIECRAPRAVLAQRARIRSRDPGRVSDADESIVLREQRSWESLEEVPAEAHLTLRTDRPIERIVDDLMALLDARLRELASSSAPSEAPSPVVSRRERSG